MTLPAGHPAATPASAAAATTPASGPAVETTTPKFVEGSTMRHVVVMTLAGSVGLMAIFVVDVANLFYIALLGEQELAAAVGYAGTVLFFLNSLCIGISIAGVALASRAIGAGETGDSRRLAGSFLLYMGLVSGVLSLALLPFLGPVLDLLGAEGRTHDLAWRFLLFTVPATPLLGLGMAFAGLLRAVGDARRAMWVTLWGAIVALVLDPLLILGLGWALDGAAIASILSRLALAVVGWYGAVRVHALVGRPTLAGLAADAGRLSAIAVPAVLTNVATPVGNAFVTAAISTYGDSAVAGWAVIGRLQPLAFGAIFALSGSVGPIIGQNFGARRFDRVQATLRDSLLFTLAYCVAVWALLALASGAIVAGFGLADEGAALVHLFCVWVSGTFVFAGALFVANAAFNNLGFPILSTAFNWGRATIGTIPFVWAGAAWGGAMGVLIGQAVGGILFGLAAIVASTLVVRRLMRKASAEKAPAPDL